MTNPNDTAFANNYFKGLTKREYIAAAALQGLLAKSGSGLGELVTEFECLAMDAVQAADFLIEELNNTKNQKTR